MSWLENHWRIINMKKHNCLTMLPKRYLVFIHTIDGKLYLKFKDGFKFNILTFKPRELKHVMRHWEKLGYMT